MSFEPGLGANVIEHQLGTPLDEKPTHEELVEDLIDFVRMKDQVEFTDVLEVLIQALHQNVDHFEDIVLRLGGIDGHDEVQGGVVSVDQLVVVEFDEITRRDVAFGDDLVGFSEEFLLQFHRTGIEELQGARLATRVEDENRFDHRARSLPDENEEK